MHRLTLCIVLFFVANKSYAGVNGDADVRAFLETIVKSDFAGDAYPRIGHVLRKGQLPGGEHDSQGPAFETYTLDSDPLVVVNDWKFLSLQRKTGSLVCGRFAFTVVAKTAGEGLPSWMSTTSRHVRALRHAEREVTLYCARSAGAKWMLVNAPLPRVSKADVIAALSESSSRLAKVPVHNRNVDPRALTNNERILASLREQLDVLLSIKDVDSDSEILR